MNKSIFLFQHHTKKGFTLVELVVVIAILAILAGLAIPMIFGIINTASETAAKTDAAELDRACREYYAAVSSGVVNSQSKGNSDQTNLPPPNSSYSTRKIIADSATVINACKFYGLSQIISHFDSGERVYGYDADGTIKPKDGTNTLVTKNTTLGTLYP